MKKGLRSLFGWVGAVKKFAKKRKKLSVLLLIIGILVMGFSVFSMNKKADAMVPMTTSSIAREDVELRIKVKGTVESLNKQTIYVPVEGSVKTLNVNRGDKVVKGQLLAAIDTTEIDAQIEKAKINLDTEKARLKVTQDDAESADLIVKNNEFKYKTAKRTYESNVKLQREGAISQKDLDDSKTAMDEVYSNFLTAKRALEDGKNVQDIRLQQNQIKLMQVEYDSLLKQREKYFVKSAIDGVVAEVYVHEGETPELQKEFMYIVDNNNMEITANVSEYDARSIHVGDRVTITSDGSGDKKYESVVAYISPFARKEETNEGGTQSIVDVKTIIKTEDGLIKSGYNASVNILCERRENVLTASYEAILTDKDGQKYVFVVKDGVTKKYKIETGLEGSLKVEIISSRVKAGDSVVLNPTEELLTNNPQKTGV